MKSIVVILKELLLGLVVPFKSRVGFKLQIFRFRENSSSKITETDWAAIPYNRISYVNKIISISKVDNYLEIGCDTDSLFHSIHLKNKIGVDPVKGGNRRMTSDDFFSTNEIYFDLVFIDGLHTYSQVRRDVVNSLKFVKVGGWIALHDLLPRNWLEEHVPRIGEGAWTGDVWKIAFELTKTNGIDFKIVNADRGIGILKILEPGVELFDDSLSLQVSNYDFYYTNLNSLPILDYEAALEWLNTLRTY